MDRIEPIRPSLPPIDTTQVRKIAEERRRAAAQEAEQRKQRERRNGAREDGQGREWTADDEQAEQDEDQDGPPRIDVRA